MLKQISHGAWKILKDNEIIILELWDDARKNNLQIRLDNKTSNYEVYNAMQQLGMVPPWKDVFNEP